jgi:outer membrane lipoprotein-sorting protein
MNKPNDKLNQAIESLQNSPVPQGPSEELMRQTLNRIALTQPQAFSPSTGTRRFSMKTFTKLAAAAVIILGVLGGLHFFHSNSSSGVVWADVVQRVQQAKAFGYQMQMTFTGEPLAGSPANMSGTVWMTADNRMKMEISADGKPGSITYLLPDQKKFVVVMSEMKKYMEMELNDDLLSKMKQQNQDPREWVQRMVNSQYKSIGKSNIDGIEVEGLETTDPAIAGGITEKILARLWVDVKTGYPIQMEMDTDMNEGKTHMHSIIHNFQWNQDVDAATFTPQISDYTPLPKIQMPKMDEQSAIAGLQKYTDMTGRYPESLSLATLMDGVQKAAKDGSAVKNKTFDPNRFKNMSQDELLKWTTEQTMSIQSIGIFYMTLVQEKKDPAYYGKTVTPGDTKSVLLRWKASDTTYKVIMGDLSVSEISADQLKHIEPAPDQPPANP